jgi:hypothetical protein
MNIDEIKSALNQHGAEIAGPTPACPDDYVLASFIEGGLSERDHEQFTEHLSGCEFCIDRIGIIGRAQDAEPDMPIPDFVSARAQKFAESANSTANGREWSRSVPRWAAAAVVVLALGLILQPQLPDKPDMDPVVRETRIINPISMGPSLLSPLEGMAISPEHDYFSWTTIANSQHYQVRIVSDEGDLLWQEQVSETRWKLPADLMLAADTEYYVRVDAYLAESKALSSDYILFKVEQSK